jgi:hypothetical protein
MDFKDFLVHAPERIRRPVLSARRHTGDAGPAFELAGRRAISASI